MLTINYLVAEQRNTYCFNLIVVRCPPLRRLSSEIKYHILTGDGAYPSPLLSSKVQGKGIFCGTYIARHNAQQVGG